MNQTETQKLAHAKKIVNFLAAQGFDDQWCRDVLDIAFNYFREDRHAVQPKKILFEQKRGEA